jgi:cytochrome c peroxidase
MAWSKHFMWDGAIVNLDMQALAPIHHPDEMGEDIAHVVTKLQRQMHYSNAFKSAFGTSTITGELTLKAISQFVLELKSTNSKYDKVMRKTKGVSFNEKEGLGYILFKKHCNTCHTEPLFTNQEFINNGLALDPELNDYGRMKITHNPKDSLKFKVPTLRNIAFTMPYMHDGRFQKLTQVLKHYENGIIKNPTLDPRLLSGSRTGILLSPEDKVNLTAFLLTLSDTSYLFNPNTDFPH